MGKRPYAVAISALLFLPALRFFAGGWAVVTLDQLPDHFVATRPVTLSFVVRQHGVTPLNNVRPTLDARSGGRQVAARVERGSRDGQYVASFSIPEPGEWTVAIYSGWGNSRLTLLPIRAVAPGSAQPVALAAADRGRQLFVAKGCVGCHIRKEAELDQGESIGPALTGKRYQAEFLSRFLADPAGNATNTGTFRMPNLGLQPAEIASLAAFLNSERVTATGH